MIGKATEEHRSPQHHADVYILHASAHQTRVYPILGLGRQYTSMKRPDEIPAFGLLFWSV